MGISGVGKVGWTWDDLRVPTAYELLEGGRGRGVWSVSRWGPFTNFAMSPPGTGKGLQAYWDIKS